MMDNREKLVELLKKIPTRNGYADLADIADFLIAHGVMVQEWISVKDRLPEEFTNVLVCDVHDDYVGKWEYKRNGIWDNEGFSFYNSDITHWMPLPDPPKGE